MKLKTLKPKFTERLKNYSRMVSTKLELNRQNAGKIAGLSAAAGMALSAHHAAEAAITYSGPVNLNATTDFGYDLPKETFNIDGLANFGISAAWLPYFYGIRQVGFGTTGATAGGTAGTATPGPNGEQIVVGGTRPDMLASGQTIDSNSPWFFTGIFPGNGNKVLVAGNNYGVGPQAADNWPNPGSGATATGFAGVRFNTAGAANQHYGWVRLQLEAASAGGSAGYVTSVTVLDWAYETTPGGAIQAGQIPEPTTAALGTLGALALGASSVRSLSRRRREQTV